MSDSTPVRPSSWISYLLTAVRAVLGTGVRPFSRPKARPPMPKAVGNVVPGTVHAPGTSTSYLLGTAPSAHSSHGSQVAFESPQHVPGSTLPDPLPDPWRPQPWSPSNTAAGHGDWPGGSSTATGAGHPDGGGQPGTTDTWHWPHWPSRTSHLTRPDGGPAVPARQRGHADADGIDGPSKKRGWFGLPFLPLLLPWSENDGQGQPGMANPGVPGEADGDAPGADVNKLQGWKRRPWEPVQWQRQPMPEGSAPHQPWQQQQPATSSLASSVQHFSAWWLVLLLLVLWLLDE